MGAISMSNATSRVMKAMLAVIASCLLAQAVPVMAAPSCPPRARDEGEPFLDKAPKIPRKYRSIMTASKTDLAIASENGKTICVKLGWVGHLEEYWHSADMRFIGFDYYGHETHGHIMIDRKGDGQEINTGARPIFSPDKKHFAFAQLSDSGWGNFEGVAVWTVNADNSTKSISVENNEDEQLLPYGIDWKVDHWIDNTNVRLSMIHADEFVPDDDYAKGVAKSPRRSYQFRQAKQTWQFLECAVSSC
jgi:hypothetical protein